MGAIFICANFPKKENFVKFVLVTGPIFSVHCAGCGAYKRAGDQTTTAAFGQAIILPDNVYVDTEGEAFKSYYCGDCASKLVVEDPTRSVNQFFSDTVGEEIEPEHLPE
jgi:hypothetical protein